MNKSLTAKVDKLSNRDEPARVYSYMRFSTPEQSLGDSERRQIELANKYARQHGLMMDEKLRMTDRGLSAYDGSNVAKGSALGCFLAGVESGRVPVGSVLVVENLDRITRQAFFDGGFEIVTRIIQAGIKIHTTSPEATYDKSSAKNGQIHALVGQVTMAHEESEKKSQRVKEAWQTNRERIARERKLNTRMCPKWLEPITERDGSIRHQVIPPAAKAIRRIFNLYLRGMGYTQITRAMNSEAIWLPPLKRIKGAPKPSSQDRWRPSYVIKLLRNRALIGELQLKRLSGKSHREPVGEPIRGAFPVVVEKNIFERVQSKLERNRIEGASGRRGSSRNVFTRLVKCAYCGSSMAHQPKGPKSHTILVCDAGRHKRGCGKSHSCHYSEFQEVILNNCASLKPDLILPNKGENNREVKRLSELIATHEARLNTLIREIENYENMVGNSGDIEVQKRYEAKAEERREASRDVEFALARARALLRQIAFESQTFNQWTTELAHLKSLISRSDGEGENARALLRDHLREFIDHVEIFTHGFRGLKDSDRVHGDVKKHSGGFKTDRIQIANIYGGPTQLDDVLEYCSEGGDNAGVNLDGATRKKWMKFLTQKFSSKEGRFYRIHFRTKAVLDVVPNGSVALGERLVSKLRVRSVNPPLDVLWRQFKAS